MFTSVREPSACASTRRAAARAAFIALTCWAALTGTAAQAQDPAPTDRLFPEFGGLHGTGDRLGASVAIDGDWGVVGAPDQRQGGTATVFERNGGWTRHAVLGTDAPADSGFGHAVAVFGNLAIAGAPFEDGDGEDAGAAYLYERSGASWNLVARLTPTDTAPAKRFGWSVGLTTGRAVIAATGDDAAGDFSGAVYIFEPVGPGWTQVDKLTAADGEPNDVFGYAVAVDGDLLVAGARFEDERAPNAGAAYVFERTGGVWVQREKLIAGDGQAGDEFGRAVAVSGDRVAVGAPFDDDGGSAAGTAYVFDRNVNDWDESQKLMRSGAASGDELGLSVSLSGDRLVLGAPGAETSGRTVVFERQSGSFTERASLATAGSSSERRAGAAVAVDGGSILAGAPADDGFGSDAGAAFAFSGSGSSWSDDGTLRGTAGSPAAAFGEALALAGSRALVGAPGADLLGTDSGAAYVFETDGTGWSLLATLLASDGQAGDEFGFSVSVNADRALVGARLNDGAGEDRGAAYVFERDGALWNEVARLDPPAGGVDDRFGHAVALDGDLALVGAIGDSVNGALAGAVHVFTFDGANWSFDQTLRPGDAASLQAFGYAVDLAGDRAIIGAPFDSQAGAFAGAAYVYERSGGSWTQVAKLRADDASGPGVFGNSVAIAGDLAVVGEPFDRSDAGAAYVFRRTAGVWAQSDRLAQPGAPDTGQFGWTVALAGSRTVIGAPEAATGFDRTGRAFVFELGIGGDPVLLADPIAAAGDFFGGAVAFGGGRALVGAPAHDEAGRDSGQAVVFDLPNAPPVAADDSYTIAEDGTLEADDADGTDTPADANDDSVLANDLDPDADELSVSEAQGAPAGQPVATDQGGTVTAQVDGRFVYQPPADYNGPDGFAYLVSDGNGSSPALVTITVTPVPDAPVVTAGQGGAIPENSPVDTPVVTLSGTDADGDELTDWAIVGGNLSIDGDGIGPFQIDAATGTIRVADPGDLDFERTASFSLQITVQDTPDGLTSQPASATVTIQNVEEPIVATSDAYDAFIGSTLTVGAAQGVLANDVDGDEAPLAVTAIDGQAVVGAPYAVPGGGTLTMAADGGFSFDPGNDFAGLGAGAATDLDLTYTVTDGNAPVVVDWTITVTNPVGTADLTVTKTNGTDTAEVDDRLSYTITITNLGPDPVPDAAVADPVPPGLGDVSWTCLATGGATCRSAGTGDLVDAPDLAVGATVVYTVDGTVTGSNAVIINRVTVTPPATIEDPDLASNVAEDVTSLGDDIFESSFEEGEDG